MPDFKQNVQTNVWLRSGGSKGSRKFMLVLEKTVKNSLYIEISKRTSVLRKLCFISRFAFVTMMKTIALKITEL